MYAVLDLGTNTFHVLIAQKEDNQWSVVDKKQWVVQLGEGGIENREIKAPALMRAWSALEEAVEMMRKYPIQKMRAIGTSALRNARGTENFILQIKEKLNLEIQIIDGMEEAQLIFEGVKHTVSFLKEPYLVMDIGGGSVEFIMAMEGKILWRQSIEAGAARILEKFHPSDPLLNEEREQITQFFSCMFSPVFKKIETYKPQHLVGAAGSFESWLELTGVTIQDNQAVEIDKPQFMKLTDWLIQSTRAERTGMPGLAGYRVDMIVASTLMAQVILSPFPQAKIWVSSASLKEGQIWTWMKGD